MYDQRFSFLIEMNNLLSKREKSNPFIRKII